MVDRTLAQILAANPATDALLTNHILYGIDDAGDDVAITPQQIAALVNVDPGGDTIIVTTNENDFKESVAVATTANITLSGEQTIDGVLTSASRVLVKNQNTGSQNGIYVSAAGAWTRADDADTSAEVSLGLMVYVEGGTTQSATYWSIQQTGTITLGTTPIVFSQVVVPSNPSVVRNSNSTAIGLTTSDPNTFTRCTSNSAVTVTAPTNGTRIAINSEMWFMKVGSGNITFAGAGGVNIRSTQGLVLRTQYAIARLKKLSSTEWSLVIVGQQLSEFSIYAGSVLTNSEEIYRYVAKRAFTIKATAPLSGGVAGTAATASTTLTFYKNGVSFGTMVWAASGTTATLTFSSDTSFAADDVLTVVGPATADATLAKIAITLMFERTA